jgi:hypothetical protein
MRNELDGLSLFREAAKRLQIHLSVLVAETTLWPSPETYLYLRNQNGTGAYFPGTRRARTGSGEHPSQLLNGERLDSNNYANHAAKRAVGLGRGATGFEVCHVWPLSCYDARYHSCVANLVLMPRPLASLSDHDSEIPAALQFRSYELYGWCPVEAEVPCRPAFYPSNWRPPELFTDEIRLAIDRRRASL